MRNPVDEHLEHHGIKGMKWGVRRKVGKNGRVGQKPKKGSVDFRTTQPLRKKKPSELSNMQLKKVNERLNLEKKFSDMNPTKMDKGKEFMDDVLKASVGAAGTAALVKIVTNPKTVPTIKKGMAVIKGTAAVGQRAPKGFTTLLRQV